MTTTESLNMKRCFVVLLAALLATLGMAAVTAGPAEAHTGDLNATYVCQNDGTYLATYTLTLSQSNLNSQTWWRVGNTSFQGTPTSNSGMSNGPINRSGPGTFTLGTQVLSGGTTTPPWVYAFTKWSDGFTKGSDGRKDSLPGNCKPSDPPTNPAKQSITCSQIYRDYGRPLQNGDHINATIKDSTGEYQINVYVDRNLGGYDTFGFRYSNGTTRNLSKEEVFAGRIWLDVPSRVRDSSYYVIKFVQINESENWPDLECGTPPSTDACPNLPGDQVEGFDCDGPSPKVKDVSEDRDSCEWGYDKRDGKVTTPYVFENGKWVLGTPGAPVWGDWYDVRDYTPAEKEAKGCAKPDKPEPRVSTEPKSEESCELGGVNKWTVTTTINSVWNATNWQWIDDAPVVTESEKVFTAYTDDQYFDLCAPDQPEPKVTEASSTSYECGDDHQIVTKTVTTVPAVWNADTRQWEDGKPVTQETVTQVSVPVVDCPVTPVKDEPKTPSATPKNVLPNTGGPTVAWVLIGLVLVGTGVYFLRRRR